MLHIISITEIKFRRLTRQVLGMQTTQEEQPTVEETINLVREMQAIRPQTPPAEPEADYGQYSQGHRAGGLVSTDGQGCGQYSQGHRAGGLVSTDGQGCGQYSQGHRAGGLVSTVRVIVPGVWSVQMVRVVVSTDRVIMVGVWSVQSGSSWRGLVSTDRVIMERFGQYR